MNEWMTTYPATVQVKTYYEGKCSDANGGADKLLSSAIKIKKTEKSYRTDTFTDMAYTFITQGNRLTDDCYE